MADGSQLGMMQGDEIDFRPAKAPTRPVAGRSPDGLDFQPSNAGVRTPKPQAGDEIDFQPKGKPETFSGLYETPQPGPSLADRAQRIGRPSPNVLAIAPKAADLTTVPRSPFTNAYQFSPPIATEEEARRQGTIGPRPIGGVAHGTRFEGFADIGERFERALGAGAPEGSKVAEWTGQRGTRDNARLFAPEQLMTEAEQQRHPILTGAGEFAGGMTSPESLTLIGLTVGAGELAGPGAAVAKRLLSAGFSIPMLISAAQTTPDIADAFKRGDIATGERLLTRAVLTAGMAGLAGRGMFEETAPAIVPRGTVSRPLAIDTALARGGRRLQDFQANEAARRGMGNLAEAERGIEAARQSRINAPVDIPRTYEGPTPILGGPPIGPQRNPLAVEAARVREERGGQEQPGFTVRDLRRVQPEEPTQPPYYQIASAQPRSNTLAIQPAPASETVGARGRTQRVSELASRVLNEQEGSLLHRFGPDVLGEARQELNAAAGLASSFERPGRYFAEYGSQEEHMPSRSTSAAKGIHAGGAWYGVGSARGMISDVHPWFADVAEGPETLSRIVQEGRGAAYDRLLERAATHIQTERESARPVVEEYAPHLESLAGQIRDTDPELAQTLQALAQGKAVGFRNLRAYIEEKIHDAETAATFSRAIEDAAAEARESAGAEESSQLGAETRSGESRSAAEARESARPIDEEIDFQPTKPQEISDVSAATMGAHPRGLSVMRRGEFANPRGAEELRNVLASQDAERNIEMGLRGERRDTAGEIREEHRSELEKQVKEAIEGPRELYSGVNPRALVQGARVLQRAWQSRVAQPLIDKVLKIGDKYQKAREADPAVAEGLHLLDNAPQYLRSKAAQEVHNVIGDLSRAQERLFTLMADADSRENLRVNHPQEYAQAQRDPAIQAALKKYKPLEQELTALREKMGGENLDQDYLRRVYEKHVAGVNKPTAEGKPAESGQFDRIIRPQDVNPYSREASAEYHYQKGLHEFGPAFATKVIAMHLKGLRDTVAREFLSKATLLQNGADGPRSITYGGQKYFRPDVAREMRNAGAKGAKEYGSYDPTAGEKFPAPAEGRYLGPKEIVNTLTDYGRKEGGEPGALRRFFQEQILGFGFGVPHVFNILRRVTQQTAGGAANPQAWVRALNVAFSKELRTRGLSGLNDPTFDMLAKHGAISTGEVANLKEYIGGNLNPANWARGLAQVGHKALFEPSSFGGFGGIDQRARLYVADLMRSQRPEVSDTQISRAVNDALGEYSRANWTDRQKLLGRFMMFPGWDFASLRWVLQHPIRTTVPPALVVMLANHALHSFGLNREEDRSDISAIHIGDRAFSTGLLRESMARNLFRPALNYAQAKIRGESNARALDEAARGLTSGAGGLLGMMRPDLSGFVALAANRQNITSSKEVFSRQDRNTPGKILPSKELENVAVFAVRHALPALDRMLDSNEDVDLRSFAGGNLGFPNYRDDAEKRLIRDTAEAERVYQRVSKLAKTNPEQARQFLKDPDNATYALFYRDLAGMTKMLNRIDQAKEAVEGGKLSDTEKQSRLQAIEKTRTNLLTHADGLSKLLFERRQKARPPALVDSLMAPVFGRQNPLAISPRTGGLQ
jgi:hypothetical protein